MRALQVLTTGEIPQLVTLPTPTPGPGELLLRIEACGLNFADLLMIDGSYQETPPTPFTLGMEVCGRVVAHGPGVSTPALGTRVLAFGGQGGLADEGVFPAALCRPVPEALTPQTAAAIQVAYGTSHLGLTRRARLQPGETLLVLGASGGVGLTAVELGRALGARVIAVARGAEKCAIAAAAGADHVLDASADIKAEVRALGGADVVYDPVGGDLFKAAMGATNPEGRILVIGFASGTLPAVPPNVLLVKNIDLIGFYWGGYLKFAPEMLTGSLDEVLALCAADKLRPHLSQVLPLDQAPEALEFLRSRRATGKVVVTMTP